MISTKARYGLRVMVDLAEHREEGYVSLKDIAVRQEISEKYLESILRLLVRGKIVKGLRGKGGGYMLLRPPEKYSVGEIIELTEGSLASVACLSPDAEACCRKECCVTVKLWEKYDMLTHRFFYGITLQDLMNGNF